MNAANEIAVDAFLERQIGFRQINQVIANVMSSLPADAVDNLDDLLEQDRRARSLARSLLSA